MKTLKNQTLIYDNNCPLCATYTSAFIKYKMLDTNGRKAFNNINQNEQSFINIKRAANEIALVDNNTKTVTYGIDGLLKVTGNSFPIIEKTGNLKPINYLLKKLYSFISYNRKVIIPSKKQCNTNLQCVPDFNLKYRILYIVFASIVTSIVLFNYSKLLPNIPNGSLTREVLITFGQIAFQALFIIKLNKETTINYIGNLLTISLLGSLILIPFLFINSIMILHPLVNLTWFGCTVLIMLLQHIKRIKLLELPKYLTLTWIVYRLIILVTILNF